MELRDNYKHVVKGVGEASYKLESGRPVKIKNALLVLGLKKNLLSIFALEYQGYNVAFVNG